MSQSLRDLIVVRHGINSNPGSMKFLCSALESIDGDEPLAHVENESYQWTESVLGQGIDLAKRILALYEAQNHRRIILIGHSQGGLLCRVAAAMLAGRAVGPPETISAETRRSLARWTLQDRAAAERVAPALAGVIMLATPNGGAFTFGQLSVLGRLTAAGMRRLFSPFGVRDLPDLMTDRLARVLQHYKVRSVKYLSISGSAISRYSAFNYDDLSSVPFLGRLGVRLDLPNDLVVEDRSVDLVQAPLPSEIEDMALQYEHVRAYVDCTSVNHTAIQGNLAVVNLVKDRMRRWLQSAGPAPRSESSAHERAV